MSSLHSGATGIPKGFRYHNGPKTPEPTAPGHESRVPSPPPRRLRLKKRRQVSHLNAPTQQFLASVAAADVPIPSVEEPHVATVDQNMIDTLPELQVQDLDDDMAIYQHLRSRAFSPPKTPALELASSLVPAKYPDWSLDSTWSSSDLESSPEYESSRPSTAFSTQTSASLFSQYSHESDDASCISPELEMGEFYEPDLKDGQDTLNKEKPRKAPWTKAMSAHLWATYLLYLQDPRVTPIRLGKSSIPPNGVCLRVAREAKRSWKGSKGQLVAAARSRSSTPTADTCKPYIQWPHTCAATRAHLRELCKLKSTNKAGRYMSRSPTPFNKAAHRRWNRRSTPARSPSVFSAQDMAMALTLSTSDTMQPQGPLAQLTSSASSEQEAQPLPNFGANDAEPVMEATRELQTSDRNRLGSPFLAKSYGPSSSSSLITGTSLPRQSNTLGSRKLLKSPVRLTRSRSGTQKRRSVKGLEDAPRKRPSLPATFWREGSQNPTASLHPQCPEHQSESNATVLKQADDDVFAPTASSGGNTASPATQNQAAMPFVLSATSSLTTPTSPPRLGSPFMGSGSSHSVPNRFSAPVNFNLTALRRPFATMQQSTQATSDAIPPRSGLASRLAYLDQRLKELRNRGNDRKRSRSPL